MAQKASSDHGLHHRIKIVSVPRLTSDTNSSNPDMQQKVAPDFRWHSLQMTGQWVSMSIDQTSGHYWLLIVISGWLVNWNNHGQFEDI